MKDRVGIRNLDAKETVGKLLECLRYAGVISKVIHNYESDEDVDGFYSFDIYAPKGVDKKTWAEMNSKRIRTFGIDARSV